MFVLLRLPGIPYNVRELFLWGGAPPFLFLFALALLWLGTGAGLAGWILSRSAYPYLLLPALVLGVCGIELLLLMASVTGESIADIAGSSNLLWWVTQRDIWGETARRVFLAMDAPELIGAVERYVRFTALFGPLVITLALLYVLSRQPRIDARLAWLVVSALPWYWLCKAIAFDWSSTDNLNELIARDGTFGWGGGGYLYGLLMLLCANAMLLIHPALGGLRRLGAVALSIAALPLGWWLLDLGMEDQVRKYGRVFSGTQFLLGPDRDQLLGQWALFGRWIVVQAGLVATLALGLWTADRIIPLPQRPPPRPRSDPWAAWRQANAGGVATPPPIRSAAD